MIAFLKNVLAKKCPKCRESDLFVQPLEIKNPLNMPERCPVCGQSFNPEPGFYYGAMFISYILSSFLFLAIAGVTIIYFDWTVEGSFALIIFIGAVTYLWFLRTSRSLWINLMIRYNPDAKNRFRVKNFDN